MNRCAPAFLLLALATGLAGCRSHHEAAQARDRAQELADRRAEIEDERQLLQQVPLPTKGQYMAVRSFESWQNPFLTVQAGMVELYVTRADANPSPVGVGGMFRPSAARRVEVNLGLDKLGEGISSVPADAWPYGRVVAIEEAHHVPPSAEPAVRRSLEATVARLNDLGIVVYDLSEGKVE